MAEVTGPLLRYDEAGLVDDLSGVPPPGRSLFAVACAERLVPAYEQFAERTGEGDPQMVRTAVAHLWARLGGQRSADLETEREAMEALVPREDESWVIEAGLAENATACVAYAIDCLLTGKPQDAAWAARQVYEAVDLLIRTRDDVDFNVEGSEERVLADPLIQAELSFQRREIETVRDVTDDQVAVLVSQFRERARADGATLFGTAM